MKLKIADLRRIQNLQYREGYSDEFCIGKKIT